jgi:hypothetical protein
MSSGWVWGVCTYIPEVGLILERGRANGKGECWDWWVDVAGSGGVGGSQSVCGGGVITVLLH